MTDGSVAEYLCTVHRDLALLQSALKRIYPTIEAEIAPDRDAVVLTGTVPDITFLRAAEGAAHNYLDAAPANPNNRVLIQDAQSATPAAQPAPAQPGQQPAPATPPAAESIRVPAAAQASGRVINLIQLQNLPPLSEEKIISAIHDIGGADVTVHRIVKGQVRDDGQDLFVLEGRVPNQVALTRILTVASQVFTGQTLAAQNIRVLADEAGALSGGQ